MEVPDSEFRTAEKMIRRMALKAKAVKRRKDTSWPQSHETSDRERIYDCRKILDYRKKSSRIKEMSVANEG